MLGTRRDIPFSSFANELGPDGHPTKEMLDALTRAATTALTSQDANARREASDQLLFLSAFEYWELTKQIFPLCEDNYLRFMVCKAMNFVVRNELGPDDRRLMQFYVLEYIQIRRHSGEVLPSFLRNSLFSVFASAIFGSWRMMAVTSEYPDTGASGSGSGGGGGGGDDEDCVYQPHKVVEILAEYLEPSEVVECLLEVISYFSKQLQSTLLDNVKKRYGSSVLPCFFNALVQLLPQQPAAALEACCTTLESVPDGFAGLIDLRRTTEKSVNLIAWERWREALQRAMDYCADTVLRQPRGPTSEACGRFMRLCSLVSCPEESFLTSRDGFSVTLINFSEKLFLLCAQDTSLSEMLELACAILVNVFERARDVTVQYFCEKPDALPAWIDAATFFLCRYDDEEEELRRLLMSLFYYLAENLLPKRREADMMNVAMRGRPRGSLNYAVDDEANFLVDPFGDSRRTPYVTVGPLDDHFTEVLHNGVLRVFQTYFNTIMANAHLRKDSQELRSTTALKMNNEKMLFPLAELLFCERIDLLTVLTDRLRETKEQYAACVRLRQQLLSGGDCSGLEALTASVAEGLGGDELSRSQSRESTVFILTHMCLSRLSVIISIVAIALINSEVRDPDVLTTIAEFGEQLLTADDDVTIDLLQCLSLLDDDDTIANSGGAGRGGASYNNNNNSNISSGGGEGTRLHLGILRAFFFFCSCTYESEFSRLPAFYEVTLNLMRFVYLHHSDVPCLMMDANILLHRMITKGISASNFLSSPKLSDIVEAVRDDRLSGLRPPRGRALTEEEKRARRFFYTTFTEVAETRYYLGFDTDNVPLVTLVRRLLSDEELNCEANIALQDLAAVTNGCHQVDFFLTIVDGVLDKKDTLAALLRQSADCAHTLVYLFAKLCTHARVFFADCRGHSQTVFELASMVLNSMCSLYGMLSYGSGDGDGQRMFRYPPDVVEPNVVYDVSDILYSLCSSPWCNIGVMIYYERVTVDVFFCGSVEILMSVSAPLLMSTQKGYDRVFRAMLAAFTMDGQTSELLHFLLMRQGIWGNLLRYLTQCLSQNFVPSILQLMHIIVRSNYQRLGRPVHYAMIDAKTLSYAFEEVAVQVTTVPHANVVQLSDAFGVMQLSYRMAPVECRARMEALLEVCSAYHRVRLRAILNVMTDNRQDALARYMQVFGQSSSLGALTAW